MDAFGWVLLALLIVLVLLGIGRLTGGVHTIVDEHHSGLLYRSGRLVRTLPPGGYWLLLPFQRIVPIDLRPRTETVPAQEILTADQVSVKVSLLLRYRIADAALAIGQAVSFQDALYADAQVALREAVGAQAIEDLVRERRGVGDALNERLAPKAQALGLALESAEVKDVILPPPLRQVFQQVVEARKAGEAALERARNEIATLRSLANAARMLDNNPSLLALKTLQTAAEGRHTLVVGTQNVGITSTPPEQSP